MGRGTKWSPHEKAIAAKAYREATLDPVSGGHQRAEDLKAKILRNMEAMSPNNVPPNKYHLRGATSIYSHLKDAVFPDLTKFIHCLRIVELSHPTGITIQQKINIAVALHTKKATSFSYLFKDLAPENTWPNYLAWLELRNLKKFAFSMSSPGGNMETELKNDDNSHPPCSIPQVIADSATTQHQDEKDEVSSVTSSASSTCSNNKTYSRPTGRNVAKATLSSGDFKRKYKQEPVSCGTNEEIKKLRMAFERRNEQVVRRNEQNARMQEFNQLKYVIELCKDDEANKEKVQILKNKLLDNALKAIASKEESISAPTQVSGVPESAQLVSHNQSM